MNAAKLENLVRSIPEGQVIRGINKGTEYIYLGLEQYHSHGKAPELDGSLVIILESSKRKRSKIRLFFTPLEFFLKDGSRFLCYGQLPPSYVLEFRRGIKKRFPNLTEFETHYKSFAKFVYQIAS
jgi:hypothetical protein